MGYDPSRFAMASVIDTCAVWNILSSQKITQAAFQAKLHFCVTTAVLYECLYKPRKRMTAEKQELITRLNRMRSENKFPVQECSIEDLVTIAANAPCQLGAGELSCIATAYKIRNIAFMTDELLARKYATDTLGLSVETTPRLYGYLHYHLHLGDADHADIIAEHERFESRPLSKFFIETFNEAMRCRLMLRTSSSPSA